MALRGTEEDRAQMLKPMSANSKRALRATSRAIFNFTFDQSFSMISSVPLGGRVDPSDSGEFSNTTQNE